MRKAALLLFSLVFAIAGCSSKSRECSQSCEKADDCTAGQYCSEQGCCETGCASNADCPDSICNLVTHQCQGSSYDGDDGGEDGGQDGGSDAGADKVADNGSDPGPGDQAADTGGGDAECLATHDRQLGEACDCDDECLADYPFCFADVMNDSGPLYCTVRDCTAGSCPTGYLCNDFYTNADPPQPPFCQKCLGGNPRGMGEECLCDTDCGQDAPDCFKDITDDTALAMCTITGCTIGDGDQCPGSYECSLSIDMTQQNNPVINFCKACDPGDHSLAEGAECGCNKDCVSGAICTKDIGSQDPKKCVMCLGGDPRGFGEACECNSDCGTDYPVCLTNNNYCSILGCLDDPNIECPTGSTCTDVFGVFSYCKKD